MRKSKEVVSVYKPLGVTPGELIIQFKKDNPEYLNETVSYAGRLDPLAHGVMVLLIGDEANSRRREYEKSDKSYTFSSILGFSTDSYDICGLVTNRLSVEEICSTIHSEKEVRECLKSFKGTWMQKFPPFSSYRIKGEALFKIARENRLDEVKIPCKEITVYDIQFITLESIEGEALLKDIKRRVDLVKGDFRQEMVIKGWEDTIDLNTKYTILKARVDVSSGTYIRGIVNDLGNKLGCYATTLEIQRTRSGEYEL